MMPPSSFQSHGNSGRSGRGRFRERPRDRFPEPGSGSPSGSPPEPQAERVVCGRRAVEEALRAGLPVRAVHVLAGSGLEREPAFQELLAQRHVRPRAAERGLLERLAGGGRHQGLLALLAPFEYADPEQLAQKVAREKGLLVVLDSVQDPHNLGAVIRSAEALGAGGLVIPKDRQAPVTPVVERAAAGATAHLPVARAGNLARALVHLKELGFWVVGADARGEKTADELDLPRPLALVLGGEHKGVRPLVLRECHATVRIPLAGKVQSLNVSVAAGVLLHALAKKSRPPAG